jgi:hypothetical protein
MSYIVTRTHVRPSTEVDWYLASPILTGEYTNWLNANWINNGKIAIDTSISEDQLTMTVVITAQDQQTWNDLTAQQQHIDFQALKTTYNAEHGITQTTTFATV